ncbi:Retinoic acid early transcript 1E [Galemys pyrenaicus]|uniref:Retinoic acid early transcript 1E n=1 Tax=Galemys pyrenaicus TaxID=202257 RepID=A0A8J6DJ10_GALPY|nr:Retinoic acid early transcript 1E [Galemys pyrenaicus]
MHSRPPQPWCEVQGSVDENPFLWCDCDRHKDTPLGPLGEKVKATKTWTDLTQTLGEVGRKLRMTLSDIKLNKTSTRETLTPYWGDEAATVMQVFLWMAGPHTLQAKLSCQHEAQRVPAASWEFSISGQRALLFDAMTGKWSATDPGASVVKQEWEDNQQLTGYLRTISLGDCSQWLQELLQHWEDMLEPTAQKPILMKSQEHRPLIAPPGPSGVRRLFSHMGLGQCAHSWVCISASPATAPSTVTSKATTVSLIPVMLLSCAILLAILGLY